MRRRRLGAEGWRAALARFAESGLSVREFCEREGLGSVSFYQWRMRVGTRTPGRRTVAAPPTAPAAGFVDLGTLSAPAQSGRLEGRLDLGGGVLLHLVRA